MSLTAFLAENAIKIENIKYVVSDRFQSEERDEKGRPIPEPWEVRCITSAEDECLRKSCIRRVPTPGKRGQFTSETDYNQYLGKLAAACTVYPNLNAAELQNSYGVMGAEALLKTMLTAGEYADYQMKIQEICGFDKTIQDEVEEAKN